MTDNRGGMGYGMLVNVGVSFETLQLARFYAHYAENREAYSGTAWGFAAHILQKANEEGLVPLLIEKTLRIYSDMHHVTEARVRQDITQDTKQ